MGLKEAMKNSAGKVYYGMHFYPGVAEYADGANGPFRVFINEKTIRQMGPSFAGKPVFVEHVDDVNEDIDQLRGVADGWVVESFFNEADGKHWVKMLVVSERGEKAIRAGLRLSNAYHPSSYGPGGEWNGVSYSKQIEGGEFEHMAIVNNPRYEESVIMTPDEFKNYNEAHRLDLQKFSNSKGKGPNKMAFKLFKREKVENSIDLDTMMVELPKSKKEMTLAAVINSLDTVLNMNGYANEEHYVKLNDKEEMSVKDLVKAHSDLKNEMEKMKADAAAKNDDGDDDDDEGMDNRDDDANDVGGSDDPEDDAHDKAEEEKEKAKREREERKDNAKKDEERKANAKEKARRLKNAREHEAHEAVVVEIAEDQIARGRARYGSN